MAEKILVVMLKAAHGLNPGERAGFDEAVAKKLIAAGAASEVKQAAEDLESAIKVLPEKAQAQLRGQVEAFIASRVEPTVKALSDARMALDEAKTAMGQKDIEIGTLKSRVAELESAAAKASEKPEPVPAPAVLEPPAGEKHKHGRK